MELFTEGVMVCKKEFGKHLKLDVSNLEVMSLMRSFKAKKYVDEVFVWSHYYWTLTDAGIEYIRGLLYIKPSIVPNTMKGGARDATETVGRAGRPDVNRVRGRGAGRA